MGAGGTRAARVVERVERTCRAHVDDRSLRIALTDDLRRAVGFDWYAWLVTDPETEVGASPVAEVPSLPDLPRLIRAKYLTRLNRWTTIGADAVSLHTATGGILGRSLLWREMLARDEVVDVASLVFRDAYGCWGWLDLWRTAPAPPFDDLALRSLTQVVDPITTALRRAQSRTFSGTMPLPVRAGPAVLVLSSELLVAAQTRETEEYLRTLVPPQAAQRPVPAAAYNVAAQLLAVEEGIDEHPPSARVHLGDGIWVTVRAARVRGHESSDAHAIAVTIEPASPAERRQLFARSHALSPRERELLEHLAHGADTRTVAGMMFLSEHTVQDHLKSIFAKTGARNRRTLLARLAGT